MKFLSNLMRRSILSVTMLSPVCAWAIHAEAALSRPALAESTPVNAGIDFDKVNASLKVALSDFSKNSSTVESLLYSLDPLLTKIEQDIYHFNAQFALPKVPWSSEGLRGEGGFSVKSNLADAKDPGFHLSFDATYQTDALALLKYKIAKVSHCEAKPKGEGVLSVLWRRHCEYVAKIQKVKSINGLYSLLQQKISAHEKDVAKYALSLENMLSELSVSQNPGIQPIISLLKAQLTKSNKILNFIEGVSLQQNKSGFILDAPSFDGFPLLGLAALHLEVSPTMIKSKGSVHVKFGKTIYAAAKPVIIEFLHGLENGEEYALKLVKLDAQVFANMIANLNTEASGL